MILEFYSGDDPDADVKFRGWLAANPRGYWTTKSSDGSWRLHRPGCSSLDFSVEVDLTKKRKYCSEDAEELKRNLRERGVSELKQCSRC
jgi:hypothetical protein